MNADEFVPDRYGWITLPIILQDVPQEVPWDSAIERKIHAGAFEIRSHGVIVETDDILVSMSNKTTWEE